MKEFTLERSLFTRVKNTFVGFAKRS
ncbi:hypothetical protein P5673_014152 [Acropora cervicornis]|uniref:Uncharacterized protein n=1 Tax=Acropora cervicornis TaxID=6130 RepID=A0AAD9V648_ACRCE|nr:hypothetical protein P5673_014152 [Acropora cervicornis]